MQYVAARVTTAAAAAQPDRRRPGGATPSTTGAGRRARALAPRCYDRWMPHVLVRAIITGFGFTLGAALFKKVSRQLGLDEPGDRPVAPPPPSDGEAQPAT